MTIGQVQYPTSLNDARQCNMAHGESNQGTLDHDLNLTRMLPGRLTRYLGRHDNPTSEIYFTGPLADLIGPAEMASASIRRVEPNVFEILDDEPATIIFRGCSERFLRKLQSAPQRQIILFMDDNLWVLDDDLFLPADYRARLLKFRTRIFFPLLALADLLISPSEKILEHAGGKSTALVHPGLIGAPSPLAHYQDGSQRVEMIFSGTRSHLADLEMIAEDLRRLLVNFPQLHLTTVLGRHSPRSLRCRNAIHLPPMSWPRYKGFLLKRHFHIALVPAINSAFNRSRSISRLLDNAYFGAAGLYSNQAPFANFLDHDVNGLLVDTGNGSWYETIVNLIKDRDQILKLASEGQSRAREIGNTARLREFWLKTLTLT